jgi:hypothetical protein
MTRRTVKVVLIVLILLDILFPLVIFTSPGTWTRLLHDLPGDDPLGLLHRLGAGWAAFALWMTVAYFRWERDPGWLMVVAGIRWSEIFADWVYVAYAQQVTDFGRVSLLIASPVNLIAGWFFYRAYRYYRCAGLPAPPTPPGSTPRS